MIETLSRGSMHPGDGTVFNCMAGVRAEPLPFGAPDAVALEAYLMERAAGLSIETPAVRP